MKVKLKLKGKVVGFVKENEQEFTFTGKTIKELLDELSVKFGVGIRYWQQQILINGKAVQDPGYKLSEGDTVTLTLHPIIGGG